MVIKYEEGSSGGTVHGGAGVALNNIPYVDPNAITDPYFVQPPEPVVSTTHINPAPVAVAPKATTKLPTVVKIPGSGDSVATVTEPIILQGEPAPVYDPTMSPSEMAAQNLANTPTETPIAEQPMLPIQPEGTVSTKKTSGTTSSGGSAVANQPDTVTPITPTVTQATGTAPASTTTPQESQSSQMMKELIAQQSTLTNEYMDNLKNMKFEYNTATDPDYQREAANLENQVAQMMVGRGGLYSSVTNSALQSGLMQLQGTFRQQKYDEFLADRDYNMKLAQMTYEKQNNDFTKAMQLISYQTDREDTAWNQTQQLAEFELTKQKEMFDQQMSIAAYKADRDDAAFSKSMQQQQLSISKANAAYNKQVAQAKTEQASAQTALNMQTAEYMAASQEFEYMQNKWREDGAADYEIASYFNVPIGADVSSQFGNRITQALYNLDSKASALAQQAKSIGDAETYLNVLTGFQSESTVDPKAIEQQYNSAYAQEYNDLIAQHQAGSSYSDLLTFMTSNYSSFVDEMGTTNYNKLIGYLDGKVSSEG